MGGDRAVAGHVERLKAHRRRHPQRDHVVDARRCDHTVLWTGVQNLTERRHDEDPTFPSRLPQAERCSLRAASRRAAEARAATPPVGPRAPDRPQVRMSGISLGGHRSDKKADYERCSPISSRRNAMKKFLALYMADASGMAEMMKNSTPEQRKKGTEAWEKWMQDNKASLADRGARSARPNASTQRGSRTPRTTSAAIPLSRRSRRGGSEDLRQGSAVLANARSDDRHDRDYGDAGDVAAFPQENSSGVSQAARISTATAVP